MRPGLLDLGRAGAHTLFMPVEEYSRKRAAYSAGLEAFKTAGAEKAASRSALSLGARLAGGRRAGSAARARSFLEASSFAPFASLRPLAQSYSQPSPIGPLERYTALAGGVRDGLIGSAALASSGALVDAATGMGNSVAVGPSVPASRRASTRESVGTSIRDSGESASVLGASSISEYKRRLLDFREGRGAGVSAGRDEAGGSAGSTGSAVPAASVAIATPPSLPSAPSAATDKHASPDTHGSHHSHHSHHPQSQQSQQSQISRAPGGIGAQDGLRGQQAAGRQQLSSPSTERARAGPSGAALPVVQAKESERGKGVSQALAGAQTPQTASLLRSGTGEPRPSTEDPSQGAPGGPASAKEASDDLAVSQLSTSAGAGASGQSDSYSRVRPDTFFSQGRGAERGGGERPQPHGPGGAGRAENAERAGQPALQRWRRDESLLGRFFQSEVEARGPAVSMSDLALCSERARRAMAKGQLERSLDERISEIIARSRWRASEEAGGGGAGRGCSRSRSRSRSRGHSRGHGHGRSHAGSLNRSGSPGPQEPTAREKGSRQRHTKDLSRPASLSHSASSAPFAPWALQDLIPVSMRSSVLADYRDAYNSLSRTGKRVLMESGIGGGQ